MLYSREEIDPRPIQWQKNGTITHAVMTAVQNMGEVIEIIDFSNGFPIAAIIESPYMYEQLAQDEYCEYLHGLVTDFEKQANKLGGLQGAIQARRATRVQSAIETIAEYDFYASLLSDNHPARTGVYVVQGTYRDKGPQTGTETAITVVPKLSEQSVERILREIKPKGFGNIPASIPGDGDTQLSSYRAYEVPTNALDLVENPLELAINAQF